MTQTRKRGGTVGWVLWGLLALTVTAIVALSFALAGKARKAQVGAAAPEREVPVRTIVLAMQRVPDVVLLPGQVEAGTDVLVPVEKPGVVAEAPVEKGDRVEKGALLLRLQDRLTPVARRRAEVEKREAGKALARWGALKQTGAVSDSDFDAMQQRSDMADVAMAEADELLAQCVVRSPVAGVVEDKSVEVGEYVREGDPVFRVVDISEVKLVTRVPERDIRWVRPERPLPFRVMTLVGESFTGKVAYVASVAGGSDNAYRVEAVVPNGDGRLRPGMIAEVELTRRDDAGVLAVRLAAVVPERGEHAVYVVEDGRAARRIVRLTGQTGSLALIREGLREGDAVVVEGQRGLQDGMRVKAVDAGPAGSPAAEGASAP